MKDHTDKQPPTLPKTDLRLARDEPVPVAVRGLLERLTEDAWQCEAGILEGADEEYLHRYRVNLRRARVLVGEAKKALAPRTARFLQCHLRAIAGRAGSARDLDVQCRLVHSLPPRALAASLGFLASLETRRKREHGALRRYLRSRNYHRRRERIRHLLANAAIPDATIASREFLADRIRHRFRKFARRAEGMEQAEDQDLHRLRIEGKKLRYLVEFSQGILSPAQAKIWIRELKSLQDKLGHAHDLSVRLGWMRDYAANRPPEPLETASLEALAATLEKLWQKARDSAVRHVRNFLEKTRKTGWPNCWIAAGNANGKHRIPQ